MAKNILNNSLLVLPTSRAIREHLQELRNTNQLIKKYISIGDFFQRAIIDGKNRKFLDKHLKIIFLKEAIANIQIEKLGFSKEFTTFLKQSEYIFRFFQELANEYVDIEQLVQHDTYALYADHLDILKAIYKNYTTLLDENNYCDTMLLPSSYEINSDYIDQFDDITLYLEGYLSKFEFKILKDVSKLKNLTLIITLNEFNKKNIILFQNFGLETELEVGYRYIIDVSNKMILEKKKHSKATNDIVISPISSQLEQIAFVKYHITKMCQNGIDPNKIAVVTPNEKISLQLELFDEEHYFNFAMGRSITNNKIVKVIKLISKILVDKEPKDDEKLKYLKIDNAIFVQLFQENWNKDITLDMFDEILNYLFSFERDEEVLEKLEQIRISMKILLFTQSESNTIVIKTKEFIKLFMTELNGITVDDVSGGKITVLGILETRAVDFDGIIVIDFNDQKIPKISVKDKFISSSLKQMVGLPSIEDRENLQRYYYKRIFDNASNIAICYIDDEQSIMSRFIVQLFSNYKEYIEKKDFKKILFKESSLQHFYSEIILDIDLSKRSWSATSLKTYLQCKRKYYFNYISNIKDHNISIKPEAYEIGNIIHNCLEEAVIKGEISNQFISNYFSTFQKNNPYLILELELWKKRLEKLVAYEKMRKQNGIEIFEVEKKFNLTHKGINIKGAIDRIDKYPDNTYEIIDYKTSASLKIDTLKTYEESTDFQLEFYYLSQRDKMIKDVCYYSLSDVTMKNEEVLEEKLALLDLHFLALKTEKVNFTCTDDLKQCTYCPYKTMCQRD
ncbi:MAG: PD-(D/E)XK nuclease family protein [Arcobacteraceae bacterium]